MKRLLAALLSGMMAISLMACGEQQAERIEEAEEEFHTRYTVHDGNTIYVGVFEPQTGEMGASGVMETQAFQYANEIRPTVTVDGKEYRIRLDVQDNQSDKTVSVTAAQKLIDDGVVAILGGVGSSLCIAASSYFEEAQIPAISPTSSNINITRGNDYYFRTCYDDLFQGRVLAHWAYDNGYTKVATINNIGNDYTSGLIKTFADEYILLGGTIVHEESFQANESDFRAILTNIKYSGVDAVFAPTQLIYASLLINQAADLGMDVQWIGGDAWSGDVILQNCGENAEGVVCDVFYAEGGNPDFDTRYKEWLNGDPDRLRNNMNSDKIIGQNACGYDSYMLLCDAIETADSLDGEAIRNALINRDSDEEYVCGRYRFDENGDAIRNTGYMVRVVDGAWQYIGTASVD